MTTSPQLDGAANWHHGLSLDDFLKEEGVFDETQACAIEEVAAWLIAVARAFETGVGVGNDRRN